ncbi:MAG: hypothetical protein EOP54_12235 [Sphingobacteriales bacterium]|nr:MAG: hypothetical protein EOP54_12235 [Sphingobacteriales bacterium]
MKVAFSLIAAILILSSCKKDFQECFVPRSVAARVIFQVIDTVRTVDSNAFVTEKIVIRDTVLNRPILKSLGLDSNIVFLGERGINSMYLFLDADTTAIKYSFQRSEDATVIDTLTITYDHYPQFISNACGYTFNYTLKTVSSTQLNIKKVQIIDPNVTLSAQPKHIVIYIPKQ